MECMEATQDSVASVPIWRHSFSPTISDEPSMEYTWRFDGPEVDLEVPFAVQTLSEEASKHESRNLLQSEFEECVRKWKNETGMFSTVQQKVIHPSYMRIIGMGKDVLPLVLMEMKLRPSHWGCALRAITGERPDAEAKSSKEQVQAWVDWGQQNNLLY